jgi:hypothetical protein
VRSQHRPGRAALATVFFSFSSPQNSLTLRIWHMGIWHMGIWHMGIWHMGIWHMGIWHMGIWHSQMGIWDLAQPHGT